MGTRAKLHSPTTLAGASAERSRCSACILTYVDSTQLLTRETSICNKMGLKTSKSNPSVDPTDFDRVCLVL
jgi:hypothetical protein